MNGSIKHKIVSIVAGLDNGSHSSNQLQGVDEALFKIFDEVVLSDDVLFERIWKATKHWDLDNGRAVDGCTGYAGMTGDDVRVIIDAITQTKQSEEKRDGYK